MKPSNFESSYGVLLGLHDIARWAFVPMLRPQSVAEHQYNVMVIAQALYDYLYPVPHNSNERAMLLEWAMWHDADEYFTTDIPSPLKRQIEAIAPGALEKLVSDKFHQLPGSRYLALKNSVKGTIAEIVVKIADVVEALAYANRYGHTPEVAVDTLYMVRQFLTDTMNGQLKLLFGHGQRAWEWDETMIHRFVGDIASGSANTRLMHLRHTPYGSRDGDVPHFPV